VLGRDDATGLVLLRAASDAVRPARLAGDRSVRVGEWVVAVGRGDTSAPWAATGVVASLGGWGQDGGGTKRAGLIATSMAIPRAAEGGALMDRDGHVVGILAGAPAGGTLAVPIDLARDVATELGRTGVAAHGRLGVRAVDSDTPRGAAITEVLAGSAAAGAGVQVGDVVVRVADVPVGDTAALVSEISRRKPDDKVDVHVRRAGKALTVRVRLDRAPVVPDGTAAAGTTSTTVSPAGTATPLAAGG
jgi:serine protease Do